MEYSRFLIISLGTGTPKNEQKFTAKMAAKWGLLDWLTHGGSTPLIDVFSQSSGDMVDFHLSTITQALNSQHSYLRIQVFFYIELVLVWTKLKKISYNNFYYNAG
jgi:hypothetical protein